ncbi:hypothetical protein FQN53_003599 [Emmonsiellopsis sp. PD_33]|nr:hypothetical protein FQN53_003599 [Emmonsiellopsis sp. PD_33]KAK2805485.1 hypothetical protein FQN51_000311 [Onygenales sp. PD_10]
MSSASGAGSSNHSFGPDISFPGRQTLRVPAQYSEMMTYGGGLDSVGDATRASEVGHTNAIERLLKLKEELRDADSEAFWKHLLEGIASICNAQCSFVATSDPRLQSTRNGQDTIMLSAEMDESPFFGIGLYLNDGHSITAMHRNYKDLSRDIPCEFMKHDKVFLIPDNLALHMDNRKNTFPFPMDAYLAVPLFSAEKCFAHFGLMWTAEGLRRRDVSWQWLEMILHSLEDSVQHRILSEESYKNPPPIQKREEPPRRGRSAGARRAPYPPAAGSHSFKPYARSLSHELRTPMQGVVGMLDVMHATVQESIENPFDPAVLSMFQELKENIEAIQDSARRAVEAADNVVHAYDLNMQIPETPQNQAEEERAGGSFRSSSRGYESRPNILIEGSNIAMNPYKRRRSSPIDWNYNSTSTSKSPKLPKRELSPRSAEIKSVVEESDKIVQAGPQVEEVKGVKEALMDAQRASTSDRRCSSHSHHKPSVFPPMVLHYSTIRDLLPVVIDQSLQVGDRPDSVQTEQTHFGEKIEVRCRSSNGRAFTKIINWSVEPSVPEGLYVDGKDFVKLVSCVFINALKFTESGHVTLVTKLNSLARCILITISDTGTGIPEDFLPNLFQPFAREDDSTTRSREGLGLGLLVAKGLSRKLGGDLRCLRSSTRGPDRGSEFEIRLPITPNDSISRPGTPPNGYPPSQSTSNTSSGIDTPTNSSTDQSKTARNSSETSPSDSSSVRPFPTRAYQSYMNGGRMVSPRRLSISSRGATLLSPNTFDKHLAEKYPLTFLVAEDNKINRRILVHMLGKLGYNDVYEAFNGKEAVRIMGEILSNDNPTDPAPLTSDRRSSSEMNTDAMIPLPEDCEMAFQENVKPTTTARPKFVDVILMDLWMPDMDGYQATEKILDMVEDHRNRTRNLNPDVLLPPSPTVLAVSADVTDEALERATKVGMEGYMTKPYKLTDLERLIVEFCGYREGWEM